MAELRRVSEETLRRNLPLLRAYGDFWITQIVSRLPGDGAHVAVIVEPLPFTRYAPFYDRGMPLVIPAARTAAGTVLDPKVKATSRLNMVLADLEGKRVNPEALSLLVDEQGNLTETLFGNLFVVHDDRVRTPNSRAILQGISRATTFDLAAGEGIMIEETQLQPYDLYTADEAFITTTSYCILPVTSLNGVPLTGPVPGPITQRLTEAWKHCVGMDFVAQMQAHGTRAAPPTPPPSSTGGG